MITTEVYTNAVVRLLAECGKSSEATKALNQLKANGRLASWLQGQLNSILSSRLKGLAVIDDFRFLLSVGGTIPGHIFENIERVSAQTTQIPHAPERTMNGGLGLDYQKSQAILKGIFSEDIRKLPPHFLKTAPKEVKVKQEVTTVGKIADAYPAPKSSASVPPPMTVAVIPGISRQGIPRPPKIVEVKIPVEVKVPYEVKVPVEVKVPYEVRIPVHIPPPPPFRPTRDHKVTQTDPLPVLHNEPDRTDAVAPKGMDSRTSSENAVFIHRPRDSNTSITSGRDGNPQQAQSPKMNSPRRSGEFGVVKPDPDQVLAQNFNSFGESGNRPLVNPYPPSPPREKPYPERIVANRPPLPPLALSTTFNNSSASQTSPNKPATPKKGVEPLSISPLPASDEVGFQENSKAFGGLSSAAFADSRGSASFNTGSGVSGNLKSENQGNLSTLPGSDVGASLQHSGPTQQSQVPDPSPSADKPEVKRQLSQTKSNRSSTSMVEPVTVTLEEGQPITSNARASSRQSQASQDNKDRQATDARPPSRSTSQANQDKKEKDDSFYGFSDDEQAKSPPKSPGNKTPKSTRSVADPNTKPKPADIPDKDASFYSDEDDKERVDNSPKKSNLSKHSNKGGDASFDFYDEESKSKAKAGADADHSFDYDDEPADQKSGNKSFDDFYQEEPVKETPVQPKVEEKKPEPKPEPKYAKVADPAIKLDVPLTKIQTALKLGRSVDDLEDQGRKFKPTKFEIPSEDVARKYLTDFTLTRIDIPERKLLGSFRCCCQV